MNKSNHWLTEANQLCSELGPEDGIDPRLLAKKFTVKPRQHKQRQLSKEAQHTLSSVLSGELSDPAFHGLIVVNVTPNVDGQYLLVCVSHIDSSITLDEAQILTKLQAIQGFLRSAIARSVKRKHVPALKFKLVRVPNEVTCYAYL